MFHSEAVFSPPLHIRSMDSCLIRTLYFFLSFFLLFIKSQNLTFYMQIIFVVCVFYCCCCCYCWWCCCHLYKNNKFCWVLNSCYEFMVLWAAFIGGDRYCNIFHADKMNYYMLSAFLCQTNKCLNLSWPWGGRVVVRSLVCVCVCVLVRTSHFEQIICSMSKFIQNRGIDEYPILFEFGVCESRPEQEQEHVKLCSWNGYDMKHRNNSNGKQRKMIVIKQKKAEKNKTKRIMFTCLLKIEVAKWAKALSKSMLRKHKKRTHNEWRIGDAICAKQWCTNYKMGHEFHWWKISRMLFGAVLYALLMPHRTTDPRSIYTSVHILRK